MTVKPKAKRPEFFSLATPLRVRGDFDDFGIGMKGGPIALGTTAVGFVVSPITTPLQRLLREDLPQGERGLRIAVQERRLGGFAGVLNSRLRSWKGADLKRLDAQHHNRHCNK